MDCRVKPGNDAWVPALRSGVTNVTARPGRRYPLFRKPAEMPLMVS